MQRQSIKSYFLSDDAPSQPQAINDQPVSPIDPLQPIDTPDPIHSSLESEVESISDALMRIDGQLYDSCCDAENVRSLFLSIAQRAHRSANLLKNYQTSD